MENLRVAAALHLYGAMAIGIIVYVHGLAIPHDRLPVRFGSVGLALSYLNSELVWSRFGMLAQPDQTDLAQIG